MAKKGNRAALRLYPGQPSFYACSVLRSGATGKTTTSRVKSLLLHAQAKHGKAEADAFLLKTKLNRDYLEDETRPLPTVVWHSALVAFASRFGRDEIVRTVRSVV